MQAGFQQHFVSPGNPSHDYVRKLNLYADAGVREYWIVEPMGKEISVYLRYHNIGRQLVQRGHFLCKDLSVLVP